ncbi:hypothetical protein P280DRAFT_254752 [Massarina eburnea CBS 473.64]|uniref:BTB domain-containing protein n=1 Tax=Massarina eburnea CBS 473.64 TaxID=1395130 RepID=A0A6A6S9V3_9PLEO|nr:hypothetical protein P280DRAFT_254752 [Massarina eburnea CBS 473.64]
MTPSFAKMIESPQFTFLVGKAKEPVVISAAAMAALSRPFDCMINGSMKEAQDQLAEIPDIDKDDFLRLCEFAYYRDYSIPSTPSEEGDAALDNDEKSDLDLEKKRRQEDEIKRADGMPLIQRHLSRTYNVADSFRSRFSKDMTLRNDLRVACRYTLLAHAKLYVLADRYLIPALKELALHKLRCDLRHTMFIHDTKAGEDFTEVVWFAYSTYNVPDRDPHTPINDLRQLLVEFIVLSIRWIESKQCFTDLFQYGGQFAFDFWETFRSEDLRIKKQITRKEKCTCPVSLRVRGKHQ